MHSIRRACFLKAINLSVFYVASRIIVFVCFVTLVITGHELKAEAVFVSMSLFNVLRFTMTLDFPKAIAIFAETLVSCKRVQVSIPSNKHFPCLTLITPLM